MNKTNSALVEREYDQDNYNSPLNSCCTVDIGPHVKCTALLTLLLLLNFFRN